MPSLSFTSLILLTYPIPGFWISLATQQVFNKQLFTFLWVPALFFQACVIMPSHFSHIRLFATQWTVACQAPLSVGFSRQEYWSGLPYPPSGDLLNPGTEPASLMSPALAGGLFNTSATWDAFLFFQASPCKWGTQLPAIMGHVLITPSLERKVKFSPF